MPKSLRIILAVFFAALSLIIAAKLANVLLGYRQANNIYGQEREKVFSSVEAQSSDVADDFSDFTVDFDSLIAEGPDVVGWLWIPDTVVSYPLVQGKDNNEYLRMTYNGVKNSSGSIFLDYRCDADFTGWNTIIYGHNMKNGEMFSTLEDFADQGYFDEHQYAYIKTPDGTFRYRLFAAYVTVTDSKSYRLDETKAQEYIENALSQSVVKSDIVPDSGDRLLLLSTCTSELNSNRFVIHAVLDTEK